MRIDSNNWRAEAPELYKFDLTDPTARLVAADYDRAYALRHLTRYAEQGFTDAEHPALAE